MLLKKKQDSNKGIDYKKKCYECTSLPFDTSIPGTYNKQIETGTDAK
jgi:hypothetical protein